jgi:hypothetical protein
VAWLWPPGAVPRADGNTLGNSLMILPPRPAWRPPRRRPGAPPPRCGCSGMSSPGRRPAAPSRRQPRTMRGISQRVFDSRRLFMAIIVQSLRRSQTLRDLL